jgi:hypothetical protein
MTTYVSCHGSIHSSRPTTFVPYYVPEVRYYSQADENLYQANELGILSRGDLGMGDPNDSYAAGGEIPNYGLSPDSSQDAALATYFEPSGGSLFLLDRSTYLCMHDGTDDNGQAKACDEDEGVHYCSGLFGRQAWSDSRLQEDIVMLACRGIRGRQNAASRAIGADPGDTDVMDATSDFVARWNAADDDGKAAIWDDPELPEGTKVMMLPNSAVGNWVATRQARWLIDSDGDLALYNYYLGSEQARYKATFDADADIAAAVARAQQQVADFKAAGPEDRLALWQALTAADQQHLAALDPEIQAFGERVDLLGGLGQPADDPVAETAVRLIDQHAAMAAGVERLTGTDADSDAVAELTMAFETFMTDANSFQMMADQPGAQHLLSTAVGVYSAGAELGVKLSLYQESPDDSTLAELRTAAETLGQWTAALQGAQSVPTG